ncbi:MAG: Asp-tRNA(Asn)/Glu-tRNA(Gln) amidotransferase GatCAB subunit B, partial [Planctomycetes bacterium]|nr:Asp-tRNA(Asn)/Glu-tRNA(Gln) amidotransferase GatCAB subunit B [Planctomycetota bacterium]
TLSSSKMMGRAIENESARRIEVLDSGGRIEQETRRWDDEKGVTFGMRTKEDAHDYRYFPEPDLPPIDIDDNWLGLIKEGIPELAHQKRARYARDYGLSEFESSVLTRHKNISDLFETVSRLSGEPLESARLISGEVMRLMNSTDTPPDDLALDANKLSTLVSLVSAGRINRGAYKETMEAVFTRNVDPGAYIAEKGLLMLSDDKAIAGAIDAVFSCHPEAVAGYRAGRAQALGFLMGQAMKELGGAGNPNMLRKALKAALDK